MVFYHFVMIGDEQKLSIYANGWLAYSYWAGVRNSCCDSSLIALAWRRVCAQTC